MKKPSRFLRIVGVLGLLGTIVAALIGPTATASAQTELPIPFDPEILFNFDDPGFTPAANVIYYPWVANDDESTGLGPADTSITVQNLDLYGTQIYIFKGVGGGSWEYVTSAALASGASKTFSAADLDIAEGEGAPIAVAGFITFDPGDGVVITNELREIPVVLSKPAGVAGDDTQVTVCVGYEIILSEEDEELTELYGFIAATEFTSDWSGEEVTYAEGEWVYPETQADLQAILDDANAGADDSPLVDPFGGLNNDGSCDDYVPAQIEGGGDEIVISSALGGVAKQAVDGENLPYTTSADTAVSGYNAFNQFEIASFDDWYLPIVQTNCGPGGCWNTILRVANLGNQNNAVTIRFFPADDGSGSLQTGFQLESLVDGGDVWHVDISDWVPEGWVGSAQIYSDGAVFAMADRVKVGYNMWLTTTGSSAPAEALLQNEGGLGNYVLFAPDVRLDYFGWNTGINVANISDEANNVNVQYFGQYGGSAQTLTQQLAPQGMTYFYDPSIGAQDNSNQDPAADVNADLIGSALIWSDYPVAVAVDATKYPESTTEADANVFQGFTYNATANIYNWQFVPLVQKGNPTDGLGATSGIQIMNPNNTATQASVYWVNQSGFQADNNGTSTLAVPAYANGFVYTMTQHNLPNGYYGSAIVHSTWPVLALSTNVDYQVQYDGSASWLAFNPCGFYRSAGAFEDEEGNLVPECFTGDPFAPVAGGSVTKTFVDEEGAPVVGAEAWLVPTGVDITDDDPDENAWIGEGVSNVDGVIEWSNVPPGQYSLYIIDVPQWNEDDDVETDFMYEFDPTVPADGPIDVIAGESYEFENVLVATEAPPSSATGYITKTLIFDDPDLAAAIADGTFNMQSVVFICQGESLEAEDLCEINESFKTLGGFEDVLETEVGPEEILEAEVGPNGESGFLITSEVPVGQYVVCAAGSVSGDFDDDELTPDDELFFADCLDAAASEEGDVGQLVYDPPFEGTGAFAADAPAIMVYEDVETRVFNYFDELVVGQFDAFVRDDDTDTPIEGADVCVYDEDSVLVECGVTDATGFAIFELGGGQYTVNASADGYEAEAQVVDYDVVADAVNGGIADTAEATADSVSALDPTGGILDVQTLIGDVPVNGISVSLFAASPLDDPASGFCGSTEVLALGTSGSDDDAGVVTEGVAEFGAAAGDYCVSATIAGTLVAANVTLDVDDPDTDVDVQLIAVVPAGSGVLDVTVVPAALDGDPGVHLVELYVEAAGDVAGDGGTCAGALTTSGTTAPNADGDGEVDIIATAGTYCVAAYSGDGFGNDPTVTTGVVLADGDPAGDVNLTVFTS